MPVAWSQDPSTKEYTLPNGTGWDPSVPPPNLEDMVEITPQSNEWTIQRAVLALSARSGRSSTLQAHSALEEGVARRQSTTRSETVSQKKARMDLLRNIFQRWDLIFFTGF
mmetsp:Transcript_29748/g.63718  ORF Transcript_29748/g.63718 Transcript_29748/m.63718 type:complete len:111 (+) Transcript_29748:739-1071(+)